MMTLSFSPSVRCFKPLLQADEQRGTFSVSAYVADFTRPAVECAIFSFLCGAWSFDTQDPENGSHRRMVSCMGTAALICKIKVYFYIYL